MPGSIVTQRFSCTFFEKKPSQAYLSLIKRNETEILILSYLICFWHRCEALETPNSRGRFLISGLMLAGLMLAFFLTFATNF